MKLIWLFVPSTKTTLINDNTQNIFWESSQALTTDDDSVRSQTLFILSLSPDKKLKIDENSWGYFFHFFYQSMSNCFHNKAKNFFTIYFAWDKSRTSPNSIDYFNQTRHFSAQMLLNNLSAKKCFRYQGRRVVQTRALFILKPFPQLSIGVQFFSAIVSFRSDDSLELNYDVKFFVRFFVCVLFRFLLGFLRARSRLGLLGVQKNLRLGPWIFTNKARNTTTSNNSKKVMRKSEAFGFERQKYERAFFNSHVSNYQIFFKASHCT